VLLSSSSSVKVVGINSKEQKVKLDDGVEIGYDKLLLAPGTSFIRYMYALNTTDDNYYECCIITVTLPVHWIKFVVSDGFLNC